MRIRILMRLFLNPGQQAYMRELASEFGAPVSQVRDELNHLNQAGLLVADKQGRQIFYRANSRHSLYPELQSMVQKALGMDRIVDSILERLGALSKAFLIDDYAEGKDSGVIDLLLVGEIDKNNLDDLVMKTEKYIRRKIRTMVISEQEFGSLGDWLQKRPNLMIWQQDKTVGKQRNGE